jgi:DNA helicase TIP49 (TBP-interacting protein)
MKIKDVKIGMKVIGNDVAERYYNYTKKGYIGTVEAISGDRIYIRGDDDSKSFSVDPKAFDKCEEESENERLKS